MKHLFLLLAICAFGLLNANTSSISTIFESNSIFFNKLDSCDTPPMINPERNKISVFMEEGCYIDGYLEIVSSACGTIYTVILNPSFTGKYTVNIPAMCQSGTYTVHFNGSSYGGI